MSKFNTIPTEYNGIQYRSLSEARWAVFFDSMQIMHYYEPEGFVFSGGEIKYLPDFYLPDTDTYFEVKGVMDDKSMMKIRKFIMECKKPIVIGYPDMTFQCSVYWGEQDDELEIDYYQDALIASKMESAISFCGKCGKPMFFDFIGLYKCKSCGVYDGDHYLCPMVDGTLRDCRGVNNDANEVLQKLTAARWAKIEYGELFNKNSVFKLKDHVNSSVIYIYKNDEDYSVAYKDGMGRAMFGNQIKMNEEATRLLVFSVGKEDRLEEFRKWCRYAIP